MKKNLRLTLIISIIINTILSLINLVGAHFLENLPLSISMSGGEWTGQFGFGIILEKLYPMSLSEEAGTKTIISFDFISFVISFIIIFIIVNIVINLIKKKW